MCALAGRRFLLHTVQPAGQLPQSTLSFPFSLFPPACLFLLVFLLCQLLHDSYKVMKK